MSITHDQNFKNLIIDYPLQALQFFAAEEAARLDPDAEIIPIRQELLKDRLSDRFFETDVPLLVQWGDGTREALLFLLEEESSPTRFSIHRLAIYCLQLADQYETDRVIPVVIFLTNQEPPRESLQLGYKDRQIMHFEPLMFRLGALRSVDHLESRNVVARIALPCMHHASQVEYAVAVGEGLKGLIELEPDPEKRLKYQEFIRHYTKQPLHKT